MQRALTLCILLVFFGYAIVIIASVNAVGINNYPYVRQKLKPLKVFIGAGALFSREKTLENYSTSYRFYSNGSWQQWQPMEKPLFDSYVNHGDFAALKHCRLDVRLTQLLYFKGYLPNRKDFFNTAAYKGFIHHLLLVHGGVEKEDSLQVSYQKLLIDSNKNNRPISLLNFKQPL